MVKKRVWLALVVGSLALAQTAYIGNAGNSTVVVVDLKAMQVREAWPGFAQPWSVAYGEGRVYVAEYVGRPDAPAPAGRVVELSREGKPLRTLKGAHYPMGVAAKGDRVYVASSAVDWTGSVRGRPEILVYGRQGEEPERRFSFPGERLGYPQSLWLDSKGLYVATTWGLLALLDPETGKELALFSLPALLNPIRGLHGDGRGGLYLTGSKDGVGRLVHVPTEALVPGEGVVDLSSRAKVLVEPLPDPWGVALLGEVLYLVTSTDQVGGTGPGGLYRVDLRTLKAERLLNLPTRYTLGLAIGE